MIDFFKLDEAIEQIKKVMPYNTPAGKNTGKGEQIFDWMLENIGELDIDWTAVDRTVYFKDYSSMVLYKITWC